MQHKYRIHASLNMFIFWKMYLKMLFLIFRHVKAISKYINDSFIHLQNIDIDFNFHDYYSLFNLKTYICTIIL